MPVLLDSVSPDWIAVTVSDRTLAIFARSSLPFLVQRIESAPLADVHAPIGTPIGNIDLDLTQLRLNSFSISDISVSAVSSPQAGVWVNLTGISAQVQMHWHYRKLLIQDSGTADAHVKDTTISLLATVLDDGGRPSVTLLQSIAHVGSLDFSLHGGESWLYNVFVSKVKGVVTGRVEAAIISGIQSAIGDVNKNLSALDVCPSLPIFNVLADASLTDHPVVSDGYAHIHLAGKFISPEGDTGSEFHPVDLPHDFTTRMARASISAASAQSFLDAFFESGGMRFVLGGEGGPFGAVSVSKVVFGEGEETVVSPSVFHQPNGLRDGFHVKGLGLGMRTGAKKGRKQGRFTAVRRVEGVKEEIEVDEYGLGWASTWRLIKQKLFPWISNQIPKVIIIEGWATEPPLISLSPQGASIFVQGIVNISFPSLGLSPALILDANLTATLQVLFKETVIYGNVDNGTCSFQTAIEVSPQPRWVDDLLETLCNRILVPAINFFTNIGYKLPPILDVQLVDPSILYSDGYLEVATDLTPLPLPGPINPNPLLSDRSDPSSVK
eukprot:CAMPEP_0184664312 /NCGR_PEP_ID=MMETSP0308-20130426/52160_1 /TAXON_ID=38269 /ORGANISM="Gloeochaete witrockiana, Strain SAG 46.84" /LENGTH=552 /DNA_ID=CAMNT_0027107615 /DNA_START=172 /DNA_END=1831 /DNA_ORIENTATION=+